MTDKSLSQADLDLATELDMDEGANTPAGDPSPKDAPAETAAKGSDKPDAAKPTSAFDGLDDEGEGKDEGKQKGKQDPAEKPADKASDPAKPAEEGKQEGDPKGKDQPENDEQKAERERLAADAKWRDRIAERMLAGIKDKITASKYERRMEQVLTQLKRFKSMDDAIVSGFAAQEKLRSGEHKKAPEDPKEAAEWRKEQGIPETPDAYQIPTIDGHQWGEQDQPVIDSFRGIAHTAGLNQEQVNALVKWQVENNKRIEAEYETRLAQVDREDREECHDKIRSEFGIAEFKPSLNIAKRLIEDDEVFGPDMAPIITSARYYDTETGNWHRLTNHPVIMRGLISLALDRYGEGAMVPTDGRVATTNRVAEIEKIMAQDYDRYVREGLADELLAIRRNEEARAAKRGKR